MDEAQRESLLQYLQRLLFQIWGCNLKQGNYEKNALLQAIAAKWRWSKYNEPWQGKKAVVCIEDAIDLPLNFCQNCRKIWMQMKSRGNYLMKSRIKNLVKKMLGINRFYRNIDARLQHLSDVQREQTSQVVRDEVKQWTWERFQRTEKMLKDVVQQNIRLQNSLDTLLFQQNLIPCHSDEKIRMVFLFQVASFWPSWESFYLGCVGDERIDVHFLFLDETATEDEQMKSARTFLEKSEILYEKYEDFDLEKYRPHVMVMQTPYDEWHRHQEHWSSVYRAQGIRLVYIPYGIEISDTEDSHRLHFHTTVIDNCWRIYTFSEQMRKDYLKYALNRNAVRAVGLPRFDALYYKDRFVLDSSIREQSGGRKIVLWKLHFPKVIKENGRELTVTPSLNLYIDFARCIKEYEDLFFIFMPHPRFRSKKNNVEIQQKVQILFEQLASCKNVYLDERDDYRESLVNAAVSMIARGAVLGEAGA
ncbi:MAG: hypothetical protein LIO96_00270 [Lachnospiraceae bacterium]|nr:hypothetical protein [Lachnospiraceae bacterium]